MDYVVASRDFKYDDGPVGAVKMGQVFQLQGHRNDHRLLRFKHVALIDVTPDELRAMAQCPVCGARFQYQNYRQRCAESHELSAAEQSKLAHMQAQKTLTEAGA